jgi:hypothetical protein
MWYRFVVLSFKASTFMGSGPIGQNTHWRMNTTVPEPMLFYHFDPLRQYYNKTFTMVLIIQNSHRISNQQPSWSHLALFFRVVSLR